MCENQRRTIKSISDVSGHTTKSEEDISSVFLFHFQDLFSSSQPTGIADCLHTLGSTVIEGMNEKLIQKCTAKAVETTIFQMNS